jgi:hypothetical protein
MVFWFEILNFCEKWLSGIRPRKLLAKFKNVSNVPLYTIIQLKKRIFRQS